MTKPGYKMTEIGEIPEEWNLDKISNLTKSIYYGITAKSTDQKSILRFLRTTDIKNFRFSEKDLPYCKITESKQNLSKFYLKKGDIIVARAGTVGVSVLVKRDLPNTIFGSYLIKIIFNEQLVDLNFIHCYLQSPIYWGKLIAAQGSTIKNINIPFIKGLFIPLPPLPEQNKIAEILSTADEIIQKVNEETTLTEKLKKGLMQTLLTKGIGHTKFKITGIGEIPEEWPLKPFTEVLQIRKRKNEDKSDKIYTIPMELIPENGTYCNYRSLNKNEVMPPTYCECGDILLPKITPSVENGKQGIVPTIPSGNAFATSEVYALFINGSLTNIYIFYLLKLSLFRKPLIDSMVGATGRQRVPKDSLFSLSFPVPPISEQQKIAEILTTVDYKLELLRNKKTYLERIKKGLMNDLVTGRVRVKIEASKGEN